MPTLEKIPAKKDLDPVIDKIENDVVELSLKCDLMTNNFFNNIEVLDQKINATAESQRAMFNNIESKVSHEVSSITTEMVEIEDELDELRSSEQHIESTITKLLIVMVFMLIVIIIMGIDLFTIL